MPQIICGNPVNENTAGDHDEQIQSGLRVAQLETFLTIAGANLRDKALNKQSESINPPIHRSTNQSINQSIALLIDEVSYCGLTMDSAERRHP